jgi:large subunit ribosomal protein L6
MSRVAKSPIPIPSGVTASLTDRVIVIKSNKGSLQQTIHTSVNVVIEDDCIKFAPKKGIDKANALAGTMRSLVNNMVKGCTHGFEKKLQLVGVGYRAKVNANIVDLTLGFSHPVKFEIPEGIVIETPTNTELVVKGIDKQLIGQVAANIRAYRPPEPYKGKGVRYTDEYVVRKEAKKK